MTVVAVVAAKDRADSVGATVAALWSVAAVDEVLVVDDGSHDDTAGEALSAGARVLKLPDNVGKGGAVEAGVAATGHADTYLLVDADLGVTARLAGELLQPVLAGEAEMTVAVLPSAGRKGGLGGVRRLAAAGIARATGGRFRPRAPLSGQRAVRGDLLRSLRLAGRFGLETALTIDAVRAGARVLEIDVAMDHRHTGRSLGGFAHRARQGAHIVRALWPRVTTTGQRVLAIVVGFSLLAVGALWSGSRWEPSSVASEERADRVILFGVPKVGLDDIGAGAMPNLDRLMRRGAVAATTVRTFAGRPTTTEGYATLGAGARVRSDGFGGYAFEATTPLEGGTAGEALRRRTGSARAGGEVAVIGAPAVLRLNDGRHLPSMPGALGEALRRSGRETAVVNNADIAGLRLPRRPVLLRPAAIAAMDAAGWVSSGAVGRRLLMDDPRAPFGIRADPTAFLGAVDDALARAELVVVDPGDMDRAAEFAALSTPAAAAEARRLALASTDRLLGEVARRAGPDDLLLVVSVAPASSDLHLTPMVAVGKGVQPGYLHSPSTRRLGVVTLTDVAPTVLDALGVPAPEGMIGQPLRYHRGKANLGALRDADRDESFRETLYYPLTAWFIVFQALAYVVAIVVFARLGGGGRWATALRWAALAVSAWPLSTFLLRAVPDVAVIGAGAVALLVAIDAALVAVALRLSRRPLAPLSWLCGATATVLAADVATGGGLQTSSLLGYSYNTAARFTGLGNTAFGVLAGATVVAVALHVHHSPRRFEAIVTGGCVLALVALVDGAPTLGSDVGGILTLVPVFALTLVALTGRRLSARSVALAAGAALVLVAAATGLDLLRPPGSRTHLGVLASRIADEGLEPLTTMLSRKASANLRSFDSVWAWMAPITAGYALAVLGWARGWGRLLPPRSPLRAAVIGVVAAGGLGYAVNDSGVVVTAAVLVFFGPLLTLVALQPDSAPPVVLEPPAAPSRAHPAAVPGAAVRARPLAAGT